MGRNCKQLTIFEGCDGAGKSTAAKELAQATDAMYVHMGPMPYASGASIFRATLDAMMPALLGHRNVVLDRAWPSEFIYGDVYRNGKHRLSEDDQRALDRIAMRCSAVVVRCDPGLRAVQQSFESGREEMLDNVEQLNRVYWRYRQLTDYTDLPIVDFDYTKQDVTSLSFRMSIYDKRNCVPLHELEAPTTGNLAATHLVVVDDEAYKQTDSDHLHSFTTALPRVHELTGRQDFMTVNMAHRKLGLRQTDVLYVTKAWYESKIAGATIDSFSTISHIKLS
jgi:thymidylate kinase